MNEKRPRRPLGAPLGRPELRIVAVGARCPLGLNALQVTTAARAQKREVRTSMLRDRREALVGLVYSRFLPENLYGPDRMIRLAAPALAEAAATLAEPVPLFLGLAGPERPDLPAGAEIELARRIVEASGARVDPAQVEVFRAGHASFAFALEAANRAIMAGLPAALVGCVDSYVHPRAIAWLDEALRLHAATIEDGIIPSEGAAFALVLATKSRDAAALFGPIMPPPIAIIRHIGTGNDPVAADPEGPIDGLASTELVQHALAAMGGLSHAGSAPRAFSPSAGPAWLMTDIDEAHRITEWSRVELRCQPAFEAAEHTRLPERFGDTGAATGALGAAYACGSFSLGSAPRGDVLIALASDGPPRGVVVLSEVS
jgi:3-oxoacyl-[acyl-carrier-protein] synthase-1